MMHLGVVNARLFCWYARVTREYVSPQWTCIDRQGAWGVYMNSLSRAIGWFSSLRILLKSERER
jgi:hypothetical protein